MTRRGTEITLAIVLLIVASAFLVAGVFRSHKIYDADTEKFGLVTFIRISDLQMIVDTTFAGVARRDGKLYSTYDRSEPRAKRACPT